MTHRTATTSRVSRKSSPPGDGAGRSALLACAGELARSGVAVEVQGSVVHDHGGHGVAAHCLLAAACCALALRWPVWGLGGLLLLVQSAVTDLDGGLGWVRRLVPRTVGRNLLVWLGERCPDAEVPASAQASPQPVLPPTRRPRRPVLAIALPADALHARDASRLLGLPLATTLLAALGILLARPLGDMATPALWACAGVLALCGLVAWATTRISPARTDASGGVDLLTRMVALLRDEAPRDADVILALVDGGTLHNDGIEVLLRNHADRLPPSLCRVLVWHPARGPLCLVAREGRILRRSADERLVRCALGLGIPSGPATTAAARAARAGWPAAALAGGREDPAAIAITLHRVALAATTGAAGTAPRPQTPSEP